MTATIQNTKFNQTLECVRIIAAVFVVCIHITFPGITGGLVTCLGRFAVPFFFAVAGYFSFGADRQQLVRRLKHILKLNLLAIAIVFAGNSILWIMWGSSPLEAMFHVLPTLSDLGDWFFLHINPFAGHLWYLTAMVVCYGIALIYRDFFGGEAPDYRTMYLAGFFLFLIRFALTDILTVSEVYILYYLYRDGLFLGFPMFAMGMFLRQYQQRIMENYHLSTGKLAGLLIFGILLSLFQWGAFYDSELPLGAVVQVAAILLLTAQKPNICGSSKLALKIVSRLRSLSTWVYILHITVYEFYEYLLQERLSTVLGSWEAWLKPITVLGITVVICLGAQLAGRIIPGKKK